MRKKSEGKALFLACSTDNLFDRNERNLHRTKTKTFGDNRIMLDKIRELQSNLPDVIQDMERDTLVLIWRR